MYNSMEEYYEHGDILFEQERERRTAANATLCVNCNSPGARYRPEEDVYLCASCSPNPYMDFYAQIRADIAELEAVAYQRGVIDGIRQAAGLPALTVGDDRSEETNDE